MKISYALITFTSAMPLKTKRCRFLGHWEQLTDLKEKSRTEFVRLEFLRLLGYFCAVRVAELCRLSVNDERVWLHMYIKFNSSKYLKLKAVETLSTWCYLMSLIRGKLLPSAIFVNSSIVASCIERYGLRTSQNMRPFVAMNRNEAQHW